MSPDPKPPHIPIWYIITEQIIHGYHYYHRIVDVYPCYLDEIDEHNKIWQAMYNTNPRIGSMLVARDAFGKMLEEYDKKNAEEKRPGYLPGD